MIKGTEAVIKINWCKIHCGFAYDWDFSPENFQNFLNDFGGDVLRAIEIAEKCKTQITKWKDLMNEITYRGRLLKGPFCGVFQAARIGLSFTIYL